MATTLVLGVAWALPGCWDYKEMENRAFVQMLGIDRREGQFEVTIQVINSQKAVGGGGGGGMRGGGEGAKAIPPFRALTARGKTVGQAINSLSGVLFREIDFEHLKVILIGEELARFGLDRIDFLDRDRKIPMNALLGVSHDPVSEVLRAATPGTQSPAEFLSKGMTHRGTRSNRTVEANFWTVFNRHLDSRLEDAFMPGVTSKLYGINYRGLAVFKKNRLAGWLNEEETAYFNGIKNEYFTSPEIPVEDPRLEGGRGFLMFDQGRGQYEVDLREGKPVLTFRAEILARLSGLPRGRIDSVKDQRRIARIFAEAEEKRYRAVIERLQKLGSDAIGFGEKLRQKRPDHPALRDWPSAYRGAPVEVDIQIQITTRGTRK